MANNIVKGVENMHVKLYNDERIDQLYSHDVSIVQSSNVFSFSLDAVLLADFARVSGQRIKRVVDLCAGNGAVGLFLSDRTHAAITMVEIQSRLADMASRSVELNGLQDRIDVINDDLKNTPQYIPKDSVDVVTCNPPYFLNYDTSEKNPNRYLAIARHELTTTLDEVAQTAADLLKMNAKLYMVYRPDRLSDLLMSLRSHRLEPKQMKLIRPRVNEDANMVLVEAIKDGKPNGLKVLPDLITHAGQQYSDEVKRILYGN